MQKKTIIQVFLFSVIIIISVIFFKFYFKPTELTKKNNSKINNSDTNQNNLMSNIKYVAADKIGNEYIVQSKLAEFDPNQPNLILMEEVKGVIQFTNSSPISISSDKAIYNKLNHDTKFFENVLAVYDDHKISSQNLELFFDRNLASISKKIIYKNLNTELRADRIEIDLVTKNSKVFMNKKTKKVKVITLN
ncbi:LPS export ABC transporter periplasmic protein LptC [Candidatus Pelagibacter sp.]|nr:LPS export ABC transporter periplasmic protein LptC [Candidatus Pelagibacter sp.]